MKMNFPLVLAVFCTIWIANSISLAQSPYPADGAIHSCFDGHHQGCGSHELMLHQDRQQEGYLEDSNDALRAMASSTSSHRTNEIRRIPVVFHIVHQNAGEDLSDEVILDQLEIMNACYRRTNEDAVDTRPDFLNLVDDTKIEFQLAEFDPDGNPTTGITRTFTDVTHFGGVLPYGPGQNTQIVQWVQDSLFYNYFRLANTDQGGIDPWDPQRYLNIWIGDLRILEPQFNNFQEIVYFAFATPPALHPNWPNEAIPFASNFQEGVFMHYVNIGSNNPNSFAPPYQAFNGINTTGKLVVHEIGHYLGLRHIWGDGNCNFDDFISDTPNASSDAQWGCNLNANTCTDNIEGADLPDMLENYMDYSSANCQNSFTIGQAGLMQSVLDEFRPDLAELFLGTEEYLVPEAVSIYPNPNAGSFSIELPKPMRSVKLRLYTAVGDEVYFQEFFDQQRIDLQLDLPQGVYVIQMETGESKLQRRVVIQ